VTAHDYVEAVLFAEAFADVLAEKAADAAFGIEATAESRHRFGLVSEEGVGPHQITELFRGLLLVQNYRGEAEAVELGLDELQVHALTHAAMANEHFVADLVVHDCCQRQSPEQSLRLIKDCDVILVELALDVILEIGTEIGVDVY